MVRQSRPVGPGWSVDKDWKDDIKALLKKKGISQAELARTIGVSPASITILFSEKTKETRLKPKIHKALGLVVPTATPAIERDEAFSRLLRVWRDLSEKEREHLIATGEIIAAKR